MMHINLDTPFIMAAMDSIFLDGVRQTGCVGYDEDAGYIERYKKVDGLLVTNGDELVIEKVLGMVEVALNQGWFFKDGAFRINPLQAALWTAPEKQ